jgi:transcriptional regulator with XRE-family HTH domain
MLVKLGDVIREKRKAADLSQAALADKARCSQQTVGKIENHHVRKPQNLPNIARALNTDTESILALVTEDIAAPERVNRGKRKQRVRSRWPFDDIKFKLFEDLEEPEQTEIEAVVFSKIKEIQARNAAAVKSGKDRVGRRRDKSQSG